MSLVLRWSLLPFALTGAVVARSAAAIALPAVAAAQESDAAIAWERDLVVAQQRARAEQKPLLLVFRCER